jgi:hypothetical protein
MVVADIDSPVGGAAYRMLRKVVILVEWSVDP